MERGALIPAPEASLRCLGFSPLCPDDVVELSSPSEEGLRGLSALRRRMVAYRGNGARLGWLLIPEEHAVVECHASGESKRKEACTRLESGAQCAGLQLPLDEIWAG